LIPDSYWLKNPDEPAYLTRVATGKAQAKKLGFTLGLSGIQDFTLTTWSGNYRSLPRYFSLLDHAQQQAPP